MAGELIKKLEREGKVVKQEAGIVQVEALLKEAIVDLGEAKKILHLAERATYIMAYNAMLKCGRALLLMKGYRPADGAQHKTVVEVTGEFLGSGYAGLVNHFETMRRKRNVMTYEAGVLLSSSEAEQALFDAIELAKKILAEAKTRDPQLEIEF